MSFRHGRQTKLCPEMSNDMANCLQPSSFQESGEDRLVWTCLHTLHAVDWLTGCVVNTSRLLFEPLVAAIDYLYGFV